ncbi:RNA-binding protein [Paraneptunicella aestuarii]|uniref:RNA recognition motif domain-containing protein n=1 Tax=Paraneptunicella aestuarii TaxID=2831148 RepID=UPI001E4535A8|nr:RNA-binding protein [Paraneptunicella aestuarii]UAA40509.1 RNA-binding protein [Paraneptunicella aestuarii]
MKLYVGNLPYRLTDGELEQTFSEFGEVTSAKIIMDREANRSKGFGFVEFGSKEDGQKAIEAMHGKEMAGRTIVVSEARPPQNNRSGGGGGQRQQRRF